MNSMSPHPQLFLFDILSLIGMPVIQILDFLLHFSSLKQVFPFLLSTSFCFLKEFLILYSSIIIYALILLIFENSFCLLENFLL